jgi:hypothetical protein
VFVRELFTFWALHLLVLVILKDILLLMEGNTVGCHYRQTPPSASISLSGILVMKGPHRLR